MQKISPLRASLDAFNRFKADRNEKQENSAKTQSTNPFGITFKGNMVTGDVFQSSQAQESSNGRSIQERMGSTGKLLASAWVSTINRFDSMKQNAVAFGQKFKQDAIAFGQKLHSTEVKMPSFDIFKNSITNLQNRPVSDLETMFKGELEMIGA